MVIDDLKTEDIKEELKSIGVHEFNTLLNEEHTIVPFFGGVIQSYSPPKRTKNGEGSFLLNLTLVEPSLDSKMSIVKMNIFHKKETSLPMVTQIGDIFLCTQMRASKKFRNLTSTPDSKWIIFDRENYEPRYSNDINYIIEERDLIMIKILQYYSNKYSLNIQQDVIRIENNKKLTKTEGLKENTYVDFVGQFLGYSNNSYTTNFPMIVIIITDYTKTKTPQSYINTKFKTNLDKDYIIQCTLYDEHANGCPDLSLGDYLLIENAYCKTSRNGSLELAVRGDRSSLSKRVKIKKLNDQDDLVKGLKIHQNQFESNHKRKHPDNDNDGNDEVIDLSKQKSIKRAPHKIYAKLNSNPEQWSFIDNVINSEIDQKYYLRVSVIDYKPKNIVDMLVKYCDQCEISTNYTSSCCRFCHKNELIPVYRCLLKIKDNNNDLILVSAYGAPNNSIFPDIPIVDIKKNIQVQEMLQTRLDLLCGNGISSGPMLNICIQSSIRYNTKRFTITDTQYIMD